jgi:hypothetical protein
MIAMRLCIRHLHSFVGHILCIHVCYGNTCMCVMVCLCAAYDNACEAWMSLIVAFDAHVGHPDR